MSMQSKYRYKKKAGALQEAYDAPAESAVLDEHEIDALLNIPQQAMAPPPPAAFRTAEATGEFAVNDLMRASVRAQSPSRDIQTMGVRDQLDRKPTMQQGSGLDPHWENHGGPSMFFYTVEDGKRVLMVSRSGQMEVVTGPSRVWRVGRTFRPMKHYVAHPSEFLIVRYRDGRQEHTAGPAHVWFDPREHQDVNKEEALPIADKEAVIVYSEGADGEVTRRIVHGPATFVPRPGEWLHTFSWHGNVGGRKVPGALEFQKLWLLPDQMYHDVPDVRTADDAVLTIRLMMFFELVDIEKMLATTHDPIGDFLNAATSDVVDYVGRHTFESFKQNTDKLNELPTYRQLVGRSDDIGYRINRVVYRGYGAKASLEQMHDQAIESRTRLQLEKATEQQAQELEDLKLERQIARDQKQRRDQSSQARAEIELQDMREAAEQSREQARRTFAREQAVLDAEQRDAMERQRVAREQEQLTELAKLGVDLTQYLTHDRADRVFELRGNGAGAHLHIGTDRG